MCEGRCLSDNMSYVICDICCRNAMRVLYDGNLLHVICDATISKPVPAAWHAAGPTAPALAAVTNVVRDDTTHPSFSMLRPCLLRLGCCHIHITSSRSRSSTSLNMTEQLPTQCLYPGRR